MCKNQLQYAESASVGDLRQTEQALAQILHLMNLLKEKGAGCQVG
jgi:hypothetical protein